MAQPDRPAVPGAPLEPGGAVVVDGSTAFRAEVLEAPGTVVVDFWAPWCAPCRAIGPVLDELARELAGHVKVVKVNTDDNQDLARAYGVESIPTLHVFHDGSLDRTMVGAHPKREIRAWVTGADRAQHA